VKRRDLIRHLERHGCRIVREEGKHSVITNPREDKVSTVPRHREINQFLARKICRDLDVPEP
jgi:predicted RNA binding protein YcfA (HicA-like mRNA interferase family)